MNLIPLCPNCACELDLTKSVKTMIWESPTCSQKCAILIDNRMSEVIKSDAYKKLENLKGLLENKMTFMKLKTYNRKAIEYYYLPMSHPKVQEEYRLNEQKLYEALSGTKIN